MHSVLVLCASVVCDIIKIPGAQKSNSEPDQAEQGLLIVQEVVGVVVDGVLHLLYTVEA